MPPEDIAAGAHVHTHNLDFRTVDTAYEFSTNLRPVAPAARRDTFRGYRRATGRVGTRNYIAVLTSVNCSATAARMIAAHFTPERLAAYPNVDGVTAFVHGTGCGMGGDGTGFEVLQRTLWGYARNPNVGGVLMAGLGCEMMQIDWLVEAYGLTPGPLFQTMNIQDVGGLRKTVELGIARIEAMLPLVDAARARGLSRLGADGGLAMRRLGCLVGDHREPGAGPCLRPAGGAGRHRRAGRDARDLRRRTSADRARGGPGGGRQAGRADPLVGGLYRTQPRLAWTTTPRRGNKKGGLTTILEKSLGAAAKGGTTPLTGVYNYAEPVTARGFTFMDSPGYDPASVTGQIASGCNLVAFTTGRGSAFGAKPSPSMKIATNSEMYRRMTEDMDIDAGRILTGDASVEEVGREIYAMCCCAWPRASTRNPRRRALATMNSCPGRSGR